MLWILNFNYLVLLTGKQQLNIADIAMHFILFYLFYLILFYFILDILSMLCLIHTLMPFFFRLYSRSEKDKERNGEKERLRLEKNECQGHQ